MSEVLLSGTNLTVAYGGLRAVSEVDFEVRAGQIVGLIGPNGAGKTSLVDGFSGFTRMTGRLEFLGNRMAGISAYRRRRLGLSRTWQSVALFDDLTVLENVSIAVRRGGKAFHPRAEALEKLRMVGLTEMAELLPTELSHGQRVLVGVARALVGSPRVLLFDEPAAGLDDNEGIALQTLLREVSDGGVGIVLIDHDMSLVMGVSDMLHVLDFGRTVAVGEPAAVMREPGVIAAYLGTVADPLSGNDVAGGTNE
ncbi:ATP-binding cassette domain-containing protein [Georgenia sp. EYE_87]|uniref:ABC transporter ATP-binding protein n=1 Tax=Georgenia sp. EYE_87 TaxID=2853448 RepID=UPI002002C603|nr:ATP-binding cassette domain-containing protein [Georgenia sp. EYE_87]MCK6212121.1 ATP-binding cassette domain-containing protein [Georgenia sp. EYE_87]